MPGGYKNIKHEDGKAWQKGQSGNPKGPRVKVFSQIAKEYQARGIEKATDAVVKEAFELLLALPVSEVIELAGNPKVENEYPALLRLMAKELMGKQGLAAIKEMLNRAHGTPAPKNDGTTHLHVTFADDDETAATKALNDAETE